MGRKVLTYPSLGDSPIIFVQFIHPQTRQNRIFQMVVDTGASSTCLPAHLAMFIGHDNRNPRVEKTVVQGVGGTSMAFVHTMRLALIDPDTVEQDKLRIFWTSPVQQVLFVEKMATQTGLLGRDLLARWKQVGFCPTRQNPHSAWNISISL